MKLRPYQQLTDLQVQSGLKYIVREGLAAEAMATLTGGTFLVAMALNMGATNFQIGLLAALPTFTNTFQLLSIWLVQKYSNRRAISVTCSFLARVPLFAIAALPLMFSSGTSIYIFIVLLSMQYFFASISGASWHSWMKDLVPQQVLGSYFSRRTRLIMTVNVTLSLVLGLSIDYVKAHYPQLEMSAYCVMYLGGGLVGMLGVYFLSKAPEPKTQLANDNVLKLLGKPLKDKNFKNLLVFHSFWAFSLNLAIPFFSVYMMKTLGLPISYLIGLGILSQLSSILALRIWGRYSDRFSNKTIISICAPVYIAVVLAYSFTGIYSSHLYRLTILVLIHLFGGSSIAGINLAIENLAVKLAPKNEAIVYISARNIVVAIFAAIAPLIGGLMADFFATHQLAWALEWQGPNGMIKIPLIHLQGWTFFFVIGSMLAVLSLRCLKNIREIGEVQKHRVVIYMRSNLTRSVRKNISKEAFVYRLNNPIIIPAIKRMMVKNIWRDVKKTA
jgi:MFS family permease